MVFDPLRLWKSYEDNGSEVTYLDMIHNVHHGRLLLEIVIQILKLLYEFWSSLNLNLSSCSRPQNLGQALRMVSSMNDSHSSQLALSYRPFLIVRELDVDLGVKGMGVIWWKACFKVCSKGSICSDVPFSVEVVCWVIKMWKIKLRTGS